MVRLNPSKCVYFVLLYVLIVDTVKPVLSGHSKIDKTKIFITNGCLMKIKSVAECNTLNLHKAIIGLEKQFLVFL